MAQKISAPEGGATLSRFIAAAVEQRVSKAGQTTLGAVPAPARTFLDTNILLYAEDPRDNRKQQIALALIVEHRRQRTGVISIQVLQEFFVNATAKLKLDVDVARYKVEFHSGFQVVEPTSGDVLAAIDFQRLHRVSFWDALILHSAKQAGCRVLLSEDMQQGQTIDGVRIVNPFL